MNPSNPVASQRFEVERKFRVADFERLREWLDDAGATRSSRNQEVDLFLAHPARDFAATGEAFRIRASDHNVALTYKGPKQGGPAKTREEIEVDCGTATNTRSDLATLFARLGFQPVATVTKTRECFEMQLDSQSVTITLDTVERIGTFVEIEVLASSVDTIPAAQTAVVRMSRMLGLAETQIEPRSYLRMVLESNAKRD